MRSFNAARSTADGAWGTLAHACPTPQTAPAVPETSGRSNSTVLIVADSIMISCALRAGVRMRSQAKRTPQKEKPRQRGVLLRNEILMDFAFSLTPSVAF